MNRFRSRLLAAAGVAFAFSALWALAVPAPVQSAMSFANWNPDEGGHLAVIRYLAVEGRLPPYRFPYDTSVHPPLYHLLAALTWKVSEPVVGERGAVLVLRMLSALLGALTVVLVGIGARPLLGARNATFAAGLAAMIPMRASLAGAINNENLAALGATGALAVLAAGSVSVFDRRRVIALGLWSALGVGAKVTALGILPIALVALGRDRGGRGRVALFVALALTPSLWWYIRNVILFGDPLRVSAADRLWSDLQPGFAQRHAATGVSALLYLRGVVHLGWRSFWGVFGAMTHHFPLPAYGLLAALHLAAAGGWSRRRVVGRAAWSAWCAFFASLVVVFLAFNWRHFTPQGRYFFPAVLPVAAFLARGISLATPAASRPRVRIAVLAGLFLLNAYALAAYSPLWGIGGAAR